MLDPVVAYCGVPPVPGAAVWNKDPILVVVLAAIALLYASGARRRSLACWRQLSFWGGYALLTLAFISPLCNLSVALFSVRIAQHVVLTAVAAPLIVIGAPERALGPFGPSPAHLRSASKCSEPNARLFGIVTLFTMVMWGWHLPALYDATFRSTAVYWLMHVTLVGSAILFWYVALFGSQSFAATLFGVFATMLQMSVLGAILTFAGRPLFLVHANTTWPWGLSPLQDQQLGGLIMWIIGGTLFAGYTAVVFAVHLSQEHDVRAMRLQ